MVEKPGLARVLKGPEDQLAKGGEPGADKATGLWMARDCLSLLPGQKTELYKCGGVGASCSLLPSLQQPIAPVPPVKSVRLPSVM